MITVDSLTKKYRKTTAVDDISFVAPAGRVTGFLGPNGAGTVSYTHLTLPTILLV